MLKAITLAAGLLTATPGLAQDRGPDWLKRPKTEEIEAVSPVSAMMKGVSGRAVIDCEVTVKGLATDCKIIEEGPGGYGFGAAALNLTPTFLFKPALEGGRPIPSRVHVPINFKMYRTAGAPPDLPGGPVYYMLPSVPWLEYPSPSAVAAAFPATAVGKAANGHVVMRCGFEVDGRLIKCDTISEEPRGKGFEKAARSLTPLFRAQLGDLGDKLDKVRFDLPIHFIDPSTEEWRDRALARPVWVQTVKPQVAESLYPEQAKTAGIPAGQGTVKCVVGAGGKLAPCEVVREEPAGFGFGLAAVKVAEVFVMNPWTAEGLPVDGGSVLMPVRLQLPPEPPKAKP